MEMLERLIAAFGGYNMPHFCPMQNVPETKKTRNHKMAYSTIGIIC